jgi:hypothetical protein
MVSDLLERATFDGDGQDGSHAPNATNHGHNIAKRPVSLHVDAEQLSAEKDNAGLGEKQRHNKQDD